MSQTDKKSGKAKGIERRTENRCAFIGVIPGRILHRSTELQFVAVDLSRKGLGIMLDPCPAEGEEILVEFAGKISRPLRFTVKHIYERSEGDGEFAVDADRNSPSLTESMQRCGIELSPDQQNVDLIELFTRYGSSSN